MPRWVQIIFRDSASPKTLYVERYYWKGRELCLELDELAPDGNPLILGYPEGRVFSTARSHLPHPGMEERPEPEALPDPPAMMISTAPAALVAAFQAMVNDAVQRAKEKT